MSVVKADFSILLARTKSNEVSERGGAFSAMFHVGLVVVSAVHGLQMALRAGGLKISQCCLALGGAR